MTKGVGHGDAFGCPQKVAEWVGQFLGEVQRGASTSCEENPFSHMKTGIYSYSSKLDAVSAS